MTASRLPLPVDELASHRAPIASRENACQLAAAWFSTAMEDRRWDAFLETTPLGQYQQSTRWARAKKIEGWRPLRVILTLDDQIAGGFQILAKETRFGRIGYVSKGPVIANEEGHMLGFALDQVVAAVSANALKALILQPPDRSRLDEGRLARRQFQPNHLVSVTSATLLVEVACRWEEIQNRMRRSTRVQVKRAKARGILVREGSQQDLGTFFGLMSATCDRQRTKPSPATEAALREVWNAFYPNGGARLTLAEYEKNAIAGLLCLCFRDRVIAWKKGWSGQHAERHPNAVLTYEAIEWAHHRGYACVDFCGFDRELALTMCAGRPLPKDQENSLYWFNLGFGSQPSLLPESRIYFSNRTLRFFYRCLRKFASGRQLANRLLGSQI